MDNCNILVISDTNISEQIIEIFKDSHVNCLVSNSLTELKNVQYKPDIIIKEFSHSSKSIEEIKNIKLFYPISALVAVVESHEDGFLKELILNGCDDIIFKEYLLNVKPVCLKHSVKNLKKGLIYDQINLEEKERLANTLSSMGDGVITTDDNGYITSFNKAAEKITGWKQHEAIHKHFDTVFKVINKVTGEVLESPYKKALDSNSTVGLTKNSVLVSRSKSEIYISASCAPIKNDSHGNIGVAVIFRDISRIINIEKKLENEQQNLMAILDVAPTGIIIVDKERTIKRINRYIESLLNKNEQQILGKRFGEAFNCKYSFENEYGCGFGTKCLDCNVRETLLNVLENNDYIYNREFLQTVIESGQEYERWVSLNSVPISVDDKKCAVIVISDITEQKKHQQALADSRNFYLKLFENFPSLIWTSEVNKKCNYLNKSWIDFTGRAIDKDLTDWWIESVHPDDVQYALNCLYQHFDLRQPYSVEYRLSHYSGEYRWVQENGSPYYDMDGNFAGYIGSCYDVTERKTSEDMLRKYQLLSENARDIILFISLEGKIAEANLAAVRQYGYSKEEITDLTIYDIRRSDKENFVFNQMYEAAINGIRFETVHFKKDGSAFPVEVNSQSTIINGQEMLISIVRDISERKNAEEKLRKSETKFRTLMETTTSSIAIHCGGKYLYVNKASEELSGYTTEELMNMNYWEVVHPDYKEMVVKRSQDRFKSNIEPKRYEIKIISKSGIEKWVDICIGLIDYEGTMAVLCTIVDISEIKKTEELLDKSRKNYRSLFLNMPEGFTYNKLILNNENNAVDFEILEANNAIAEIVGKKPEDMTGKMASQMNMDNFEERMQVYNQVSNDGKTVRFNDIYLKSKNKYVSISAYSPEKGYVAVIFSDITDRKIAEKKLKESEEGYRSLVEAVPDMIIHIDKYGKCIWTNSEGINFFGKQVSGSLLKDYIVDSEELKKIIIEFSDLVSCKKKYAKIDLLLCNSHGEARLIQWNCSTIIKSNEVSGILAIGRDITESRRAEFELQRSKEAAETANKAKSEFLANMSHEIRTPLNGIIGMTDLTLMTKLDTDQKENLNIIKTCADSLLKVINDVLDFSKIEAGKMSIEKIEFNIRGLIESIIKAHSTKIYGKELELISHFDEDVPNFIYSDPNRLQQIINNLLGNAIKFTESGRITINITNYQGSKSKTYIKFCVSDTGIGIDSSEMHKLFKSFSQVDGSITRRFGGTGLGLAICKQLVEMMGGNIWVESKKGKGSQFYFTILLDHAKDSINTKIEDIPDLKIRNLLTKKINILIVEDDKFNQLVIEKILTGYGHIVTVVNNGAEAVEIFQKENFDAILMDIQMPVMDGMEATKRIRKMEMKTGNHTPIIAFTAHALSGDKEKFLSAGMDYYISKPLKTNEMLEILDKAVNNNISLKLENIPFSQTLRIENNKGLKESGCNGTSLSNADFVDELDSAIHDGNFEEIEKLAHVIKDIAINQEFDEIRKSAFKMELEARKQNISGIEKIFQENKTKLKEVIIKKGVE